MEELPYSYSLPKPALSTTSTFRYSTFLTLPDSSPTTDQLTNATCITRVGRRYYAALIPAVDRA